MLERRLTPEAVMDVLRSSMGDVPKPLESRVNRAHWGIITLFGPLEIGKLRMQLPGSTRQQELRVVFEPWLKRITTTEDFPYNTELHPKLANVLRSGKAFDNMPVYTQDMTVLDGTARTVAAYAVSLENPRLQLDIILEIPFA